MQIFSIIADVLIIAANTALITVILRRWKR